MNRIGILQGRLLPQNRKKLQVFPSETWEQEFEVAKECGFSCMELLLDADGWQKNPLLSKEGVKRIAEVSEKANIPVPSICADFFQGHPIQENASILKKLVKACSTIRCRTILVPLFKEEDINDKLVEFLRACYVMLEDHHVRLGLETALASPRLGNLIKEINHPSIGIYYDSGNSAYLGYNAAEEICQLGDWIYGVHVKDRNSKGENVILGTGLVDFEGCFQALKEIGYKGDYILETCMGDNPIQVAKYHLDFVRGFLS